MGLTKKEQKILLQKTKEMKGGFDELPNQIKDCEWKSQLLYWIYQKQVKMKSNVRFEINEIKRTFGDRNIYYGFLQNLIGYGILSQHKATNFPKNNIYFITNPIMLENLIKEVFVK